MVDARHDGEYRDFRALCETSGVGLWHVDQAGRSLYISPAMRGMLEVDALDELRDVPFRRFFSEASLHELEQAQGSGLGAVGLEARLIGRRGGARDVLISGALVNDTGGALVGVKAAFTDITARRRAERELFESEQRLRSVFSASMDAIAVAHAGLHVMLNPAYLRMFGYQHERELLGQPVLATVAREERPRIEAYLRERSSGSDAHWHTLGLRRSGETFPLDVHIAVYEQDGKRYVMAILRDLTAQLKLEEQLRHAQKMDALGRLSGGLAHDFNNLLMVMLGWAELIALKPADPKSVAASARVITATGERAMALTRQLLALSRRQVVERKVIDLNAVVTETATMLRRLLAADVELVVECAPGPVPVLIDAGQAQQVLLNLCLNARDAIVGSGSILISTCHVTLTEEEAAILPGLGAGEVVKLVVRDTGLGMDARTLERAFEPFFTTKPAGAGTGLGLATVYGIVTQSGGHVSAASCRGEGTSVTVILPVVDRPLSPEQVGPEPVSQRGTSTILIVDDELSVREVVVGFLESCGYRVFSASSAAEALAVYEREAPIAAVVTDVLMPGMNGADLARELDRLCPGLPIVFMSGYAHDESDSMSTTRAHSAFLAKPFSLSELTVTLERVLGKAPHVV